MRIFITLALAACSQSQDADPTEQTLNALVATSENCGGYTVTTTSVSCLDHTHAQSALDCMTNALTNGSTASFTVGSLDHNAFTEEIVTLAVDHEVRNFTDYPTGDGFHDHAYAVEGSPCVGPFHLTDIGPLCGAEAEAFDLVVDGCP